MIDLTPFCDPDIPGRERPWTRHGYTWATDGRILVRTEPQSFEDNPLAPNTSEVMKRYQEIGVFESLPELPNASPCDNCSGQGEWKDGTICDDCDGGGKGITSCKIAVRWFDLRFLERMAKLPGVEIIKAGAKPDVMSFRFNGGIGLLMPLTGPITGSTEVAL